MPTDGNGQSSYRPSKTLWNRTYIGLLLAQFLAAFNDQAIHAAAMFFAINTQVLSEPQAISLMPILFYAPWAIFCTLSGYLADRYSKRGSLIFWKVAELGITAIALLGFYLGRQEGSVATGVWLVLSAVFLMGTHSAFFVPAKYGVMPEILDGSILSKGNGVLESLSFLAVILGTVSGGVMSFLFLNNEVNIGIVLLILAGVGVVGSLLIKPMPAANAGRPFPKYLYGPLWNNLRILTKSKPLSFAVIGIAFFTFIVAFMRATVYMLGESQNPRWDELKTSLVVGTVALGVGLGSPLAGWLSGKKIELGLIPIGGVGMVLGCIGAAFSLSYLPGLVACTILIGICTGFYLVPLFTLLQYRAPKSSKGDMVATSNFVNVTGAIAASLLFGLLVFGAKKAKFVNLVPGQLIATGKLGEMHNLHGRTVAVDIVPVEPDEEDIEAWFDYDPTPKTFGTKPRADEIKFDLLNHLFDNHDTARPEVHLGRTVEKGDNVTVNAFELDGVQHYSINEIGEKQYTHLDARRLPQFLFLGAALLTFSVLLILWVRVRDLPQRSMRLLSASTRPRYILDNLGVLPGDGPLVLRIKNKDPNVLKNIASAADRFVQFIEDHTNLELVEKTIRKGHIVGLVGDTLENQEMILTLKDRTGARIIHVIVTEQQIQFEDPETNKPE